MDEERDMGQQDSNVTVSIKLTQKQAGALYMKCMRLEDKLKEARGRIAELEAPGERADQAVCEEIDNRDIWEDKATRLAEKVGELLGVDVGEHSSANCPVASAMKAIEGRATGCAPSELQAQAIEDAAVKHRQSMVEGGSSWFCRVADLMEEADQLRQQGGES